MINEEQNSIGWPHFKHTTANSQGKKKQEGEDKQEEEEKQPNWLGYSTWDTLPEIKATFATISEPLITVGENKKNKVKTVISWLGETEDTSLQENSHQDQYLLGNNCPRDSIITQNTL